MKPNRTKRLILDCLKKNWVVLALLFIIPFINFVVFTLYDIMFEPLLYADVFLLVFVFVFLGIDFLKERNRSKEREESILAVVSDINNLIPAKTLLESDYQEMIQRIKKKTELLSTQYVEEKQDMMDYYTAWVHQIKTPISVMKMNLSEDTSEGRALLAELFRIEQYVDMVLSYIRLGSDTNDLLIREYALDEMIRETIRKFASQFILKKLKLVYEPTSIKVVTDKKWFVCILEQLVSNAVKYTASGAVTIKAVDGKLEIIDTGIGIAKEDLPRIFEKGYTGKNGRIGEKSSGLGLYLAKTAANKLALTMSCQSIVGKGSRFIITFHQYKK